MLDGQDKQYFKKTLRKKGFDTVHIARAMEAFEETQTHSQQVSRLEESRYDSIKAGILRLDWKKNLVWTFGFDTNKPTGMGTLYNQLCNFSVSTLAKLLLEIVEHYNKPKK